MGGRGVQVLCAAGAVVVLSSCGGRSPGVGGASASFRCGTDGGDAALSQVALDGGVPIEQYARAMAIVRCNYFSRCFGLAPYAANECVDALVAFGGWSYATCARTGTGSTPTCTGVRLAYPYAQLLQAVDAGTVQYDSQRSAECVAALQVQGCADSQLIETIPACSSVFTCPADGGSGAGPDGGAGPGVSCATLVFEYSGALRFAGQSPPSTCSSAADCADAGSPEGPASYCASGFCSISPCGVFDAVCTARAQVGQPCVANAYSIVHSGDLQTATENCAPGLACSGAGDGGAGSCVTPQDVGGSCARAADCKPGLACGCGICQVPPSAGPCADGLCKLGVAYCDLAANVCKPVHEQGEDCSPNEQLNACAPGLVCNPTSAGWICQPI